MESDPPFHSDLRRALIGFFSPRQIEPLEPLVRRLADDLLDPVLTEGIHDLSRDYAWRVPTAMTCHLLGLTELDQFHEWAEQIVYGRGEDSASSAAASRAAWSYIDRVVEARESRPGTDLISTVLGVHVQGRRLSRKEAVDTVFSYSWPDSTTLRSRYERAFSHWPKSDLCENDSGRSLRSSPHSLRSGFAFRPQCPGCVAGRPATWISAAWSSRPVSASTCCGDPRIAIPRSSSILTPLFPIGFPTGTWPSGSGSTGVSVLPSPASRFASR